MNFFSYIFKKRYGAVFFVTEIAAAAVVVWFGIKSEKPVRPDVIPNGDYSYAVDYVDYEINRLMQEYDLPSVVIALIDEKDVIYKKAYGLSDIEKNSPATLDTVYKMESITKVLTGLEVMLKRLKKWLK